ncbi:MAG: amidohydrolase [Caldithrix sp.]|nr:amidohydrolase [Caldithrix sp.]
MQDLMVTMIQSDLDWEDASKNRSKFDAKIDTITQDTHLIILPEMFSTGFTMEAETLAESMDGPTIQWMKEKARDKEAYLLGSIIIEEKGAFYNRLLSVGPEGQFHYYDKAHLFRMARENDVYQKGKSHLTFTVNGWKIRPFVCYDLRFPVWNRNVQLSFDLAVFIANWPERRSHHWRTLLAARAIENQCYVAGLNRVGRDGKDIHYKGDSMVIDPLGNVLLHQRNMESIENVRLSAHSMKNYRAKFPAWKDAERFEIIPANEA